MHDEDKSLLEQLLQGELRSHFSLVGLVQGQYGVDRILIAYFRVLQKVHDNCGLNLCRLALDGIFFSRELPPVLSLRGDDCDTVPGSSEAVGGIRSAMILEQYQRVTDDVSGNLQNGRWRTEDGKQINWLTGCLAGGGQRVSRDED